MEIGKKAKELCRITGIIQDLKVDVMNLEFEFVETQGEVRKHIQACEGKHSQQVVYSTFHDALTQVCYGCKKVRSSKRFL